jgi:hypothetical protein
VEVLGVTPTATPLPGASRGIFWKIIGIRKADKPPRKRRGRRVGAKSSPPLPLPERGLHALLREAFPLKEGGGGLPPPLSPPPGRTRTRENPKRKSPFTKRKTPQEEENPLTKTKILYKEGKISSPRQKSFVNERKRLIQGKNLRSTTSKPKKTRSRIDPGSKSI